jgi:hypothetical protein
MDETEYCLGIAGERGELERVFQPKLGAEQTQTVKELDGFGIGHFVRLKHKLDGDFFSQPPFGLAGALVSPGKVFFDPLQPRRQLDSWGSRYKTGGDRKFQCP